MIGMIPLVLGAALSGTADTIFADGFEAAAAGGCAASRQTTAYISYDYNFNDVLPNVDVTQFVNIWGRSSAEGQIGPWPGQNTPVLITLNRGEFIGAQFTVPASGLSPTQTGRYTHGETAAGPPLTMAISTACGDFNPPSSFCVATNVGVGGPLVSWRIPTANGDAYCVLQPGQTYFVNFKLTDPNVVDPDACQDNICTDAINNNETP